MGTGEVPTPGEYVLLKERPVRLVVAMIILPEFVWKILRLQYQIPDPKLSTLGMVGRNTQRLRMDSDVTRGKVASAMTHMQIHQPNHDTETFTTPTCTLQRSSNIHIL